MSTKLPEIEAIKNLSPESITALGTKVRRINAMTSIINEETKKYNEIKPDHPSKQEKAIDINNASIQLIHERLDWVSLNITEIYTRIEALAVLMQKTMTK